MTILKMEVCEPGFYWVTGVDSDANHDPNIPTVAQLCQRDNGNGKIYLFWAIPLWECEVSYNDLLPLHPKPLTPIMQ